MSQSKENNVELFLRCYFGIDKSLYSYKFGIHTPVTSYPQFLTATMVVTTNNIHRRITFAGPASDKIIFIYYSMYFVSFRI